MQIQRDTLQSIIGILFLITIPTVIVMSIAFLLGFYPIITIRIAAVGVLALIGLVLAGKFTKEIL